MISGRTGSFEATALLLLVFSLPLSAEGIYEMRSRWTARAHNQQTFVVTEVDRIADHADKSAFLVTRGTHRYVVLLVSDYENAKITRMIRNVDSDEYVQMSYTYRSSAKTRAGFIAEGKSGAHNQDHDILYQSNRGQYATRESQLGSGDVRKALRGILSPQFAAELQSLQSELLGHTNLRVVCHQLITPWSGKACERQSAPVIAGAKPDCDVDAAFGFPCSASQRTRSANADVRISTGTRY